MPLSDDDCGFTEEKAGQNLAVLAEALYLINLLLLPGIAFLLLLGIWFKYRESAPALPRLISEEGFFTGLSGSGQFKQDMFERWVQGIRFIYFNQGYIQAKLIVRKLLLLQIKKVFISLSMWTRANSLMWVKLIFLGIFYSPEKNFWKPSNLMKLRFLLTMFYKET